MCVCAHSIRRPMFTACDYRLYHHCLYYLYPSIYVYWVCMHLCDMCVCMQLLVHRQFCVSVCVRVYAPSEGWLIQGEYTLFYPHQSQPHPLSLPQGVDEICQMGMDACTLQIQRFDHHNTPALPQVYYIRRCLHPKQSSISHFLTLFSESCSVLFEGENIAEDTRSYNQQSELIFCFVSWLISW